MEPVLPARVDGLFEARAAAADLRCRHALLPAADGEAGAAQGATTYAELASRARTLSEALRSAGVRPGCAVALCADRSVAFVVAALGVLRLGAAFAPVAGLDPPSRYARLLARCAALVAEQSPLVSSKEAGPLPRCARDFSGAVIQLGRDGAVASVVGTAQGCEHEPLDPAVAYVLLTSGSTGHPKGYAQQQSHHTVAHPPSVVERASVLWVCSVLGTHAGLINRAAWYHEAYPLLPDDVCCARTAPTFVDSVAELFGAHCMCCACSHAMPGSSCAVRWCAGVLHRQRRFCSGHLAAVSCCCQARSHGIADGYYHVSHSIVSQGWSSSRACSMHLWRSCGRRRPMDSPFVSFR
jgi:non-ribosomal peptide synthetase component F